MTNTTTDVVKQVCNEYSVQKTVMSDRGLQFLSKEFKVFANQYCFDHITSNQRYLQTNTLIEQRVQTVKQCLEKCMATGHSPYLGMLIHRAT